MLTWRRGICDTAASMLRDVSWLALSCKRLARRASLSPAAVRFARYPAQERYVNEIEGSLSHRTAGQAARRAQQVAKIATVL